MSPLPWRRRPTLFYKVTYRHLPIYRYEVLCDTKYVTVAIGRRCTLCRECPMARVTQVVENLDYAKIDLVNKNSMYFLASALREKVCRRRPMAWLTHGMADPWRM